MIVQSEKEAETTSNLLKEILYELERSSTRTPETVTTAAIPMPPLPKPKTSNEPIGAPMDVS